MKLPLIVLLTLPAFAQAVVESSVLSGAAAAAATGAKSAGKSAGAVFGRVGELAGKAPQAAAPATAAAREQQPLPPPAAKPKPVEPAAVKVGLTRRELLARCGEPTMSVLGNRRSASAETFWYATTDNDELKVELEAGVVTRVTSLRAERQLRKR